MEDEPSFLWEASPDEVNKENNSSEADCHSDIEDFIKGIFIYSLTINLEYYF